MSGVSQESSLGPLLFIFLYKKKFPENKTDYLFAEETAIKTTWTPKTTDSQHQLALNNVTHWLAQNKLTLNEKKYKDHVFQKEESQWRRLFILGGKK